jgi:hypothetical protein
VASFSGNRSRVADATPDGEWQPPHFAASKTGKTSDWKITGSGTVF